MTLHVPATHDPAHLPQLPETGCETPATKRGLLTRLRRDVSGQDLIEYALAAALVGLTAVSSMNALAANIADSLGVVSNSVANSIPPDPPPDNHHHDHDDH